MRYARQKFRINTPQVVHDTFDGEAVIINLESGNYYSLEKSGEYIWNHLAAGFSVSEIARNLTNLYPDEAPRIERELEKFIDQLNEEKLVQVLDSEMEISDIKLSSNLNSDSFESPVLNRYTDMQELLLLDPIHEVDDMGWPSKSGKE
jgi:hypothetical protein